MSSTVSRPTSTVFLGLTLGCARCHNHKYDPFTQKDFYQMFAYFNNVPELGRAMKYGNSPPVVPAPTRDQQQQLNACCSACSANDRVKNEARAIESAQKSWEAALPKEAPHTGLLRADWSKRRPLMILRRTDREAATVEGRVGTSRFVRRQSRRGRWAMSARSTSKTASRCRPGSTPDTVPDGSIMSRMADNPKGKGYGVHADKGQNPRQLTSVYADDAIRLETEETLAAEALVSHRRLL